MIYANEFNDQRVNNKILIERLANGWAVTLPINPPEMPSIIDGEFFKQVANNMVDRMKEEKDPLLQEIEERNKIKKPRAGVPREIGYVPQKENVFVFHEYDKLLEFLANTIW